MPKQSAGFSRFMSQGSARTVVYVAASIAVCSSASIAVAHLSHHSHNLDVTTSAPSTEAASTSVNTDLPDLITPAPDPQPSNASASNSTSASINNGKASVTVNGQPVALPTNGSVQTQVPTADGTGTTNLDISVQNNSTNSTGGSYSSTSINSYSSSSSYNNGNQSIQVFNSGGTH